MVSTIQVVLRGPDPTLFSGSGSITEQSSSAVEEEERTVKMISLAEKYHRCLSDPYSPLALLPRRTPLRLVAKYCTIAMEYALAQKRSLQVLHQLLRVREVDLRVNNDAKV